MINKFFLNTPQSSFLIDEYLSIFVFLTIASLISLLILMFSYFLAVQNPEVEKLSSYECGFEPYEDARRQFEVKFYIIAILFIVFDVEAMYIYPWCTSLSVLPITGFWTMIDFIIEVGIGLIYIWLIGALDWK